MTLNTHVFEKLISFCCEICLFSISSCEALLAVIMGGSEQINYSLSLQHKTEASLNAVVYKIKRHLTEEDALAYKNKQKSHKSLRQLMQQMADRSVRLCVVELIESQQKKHFNKADRTSDLLCPDYTTQQLRSTLLQQIICNLLKSIFLRIPVRLISQ